MQEPKNTVTIANEVKDKAQDVDVPQSASQEASRVSKRQNIIQQRQNEATPEKKGITK